MIVHRRTQIASALLLALALAVPNTTATAADGDSATTPVTTLQPPSPQAVQRNDKPWGGTEANTLELSLTEAIRQALENNLGIEIQRFNPLIAEENLDITWGVYDPTFESEAFWTRVRRPNAFSLTGTTFNATKTTGGNAGFVGLVPFLSTTYSAKIDTQRFTTNSGVQAFSPEFDAAYVMTLSQPLLRDLIWNEPWTRVKVSNIAYASSIETFRQQVMDIVRGTEDAYWNLIARNEEMRVAQKSLETALALLKQTQTQYDVGVVSKVEVIQADAGVADRQFRLIAAENAYRRSQDVLIRTVLGEQLRPDTTLAIEPTDRADTYVRYDIDVEEATGIAFANRPELELANQEIERLAIEQKFAKNQRLPRLDVVATYAYEMLAGQPNAACAPPICTAPPISQSYGDAWNRNGGNNYDVRGIFSIPIPNTSARARYTQSQIELRQATTQKRRIELDIVFDIRQAARDITAAQNGIEASERGVAAAAEQLRAEEIRLEYGESTPFDVLLREESLVQAQSQKIGAYQVYRTSVTALDRNQGTILRNRNIAIDDVLPLR